MPLIEYKYLKTRLIFPFLLQETLGTALFSGRQCVRLYLNPRTRPSADTDTFRRWRSAAAASSSRRCQRCENVDWWNGIQEKKKQKERKTKTKGAASDDHCVKFSVLRLLRCFCCCFIFSFSFSWPMVRLQNAGSRRTRSLSRSSKKKPLTPRTPHTQILSPTH